MCIVCDVIIIYYTVWVSSLTSKERFCDFPSFGDLVRGSARSPSSGEVVYSAGGLSPVVFIPLFVQYCPNIHSFC